MQCPKCGFEQPVGEECMACGVIFAKLPAQLRPQELELLAATSSASPSASPSAAAPPPPLAPGSLPSGQRFDNKYGLPDVYEGPVPPPPGAASSEAAVGDRHPTYRTGSSPTAELSVFRVTVDAARAFVRNLIPFVAISMFALAPGAVIVYYATTSSLRVEELADLRRVLLLLAVSAIANLAGTAVATGGVTFGVVLHLDGQEVDIERCLGFGLRTLLPVVGVALLQSLIVSFGLLLCILPGIVLLTVYAVAIPALVQERCGVVEALRRSNHLTDGHRLTIFGLLFILGAVHGGSDRLVLQLLGGDLLATDYLIASSLLDIAFTGLQATAIALIYYRLRELHERSSVHSMAAEIASY